MINNPRVCIHCHRAILHFLILYCLLPRSAPSVSAVAWLSLPLIEREFARRQRVMDANEFLHGVGQGRVLRPFAGFEGEAGRHHPGG
jgi:hypothetical protein